MDTDRRLARSAVVLEIMFLCKCVLFCSKEHNAKVAGSLLHSSVMWFFAAAAADIQLLSQKSTDLLRSEVPRWGGLLHFLCQTCKPGVCWTTFCLHFFKLNIEWTKLQVKKHVRSGRSADSHTFPLRTQPELFYDIGVFFFCAVCERATN